MLRYIIEPDPQRRLYRLTLRCRADELPDGCLFAASWTPGSYLMREYAGRFRRIEAQNAGSALAVEAVSKNAWRLDLSELAADAALEIRWSVHAASLGIHDAFISAERGFVNPAAVLLAPRGAMGDFAHPVSIEWEPRGFRIFSPLPRTAASSFEAPCFEALVDSPFALADESLADFAFFTVEACGVPHDVLLTGTSAVNEARIAEDLRKIFEATIRFWDPKAGRAPFSRYLLQANFSPNRYGGLEHAEGAVLLHDPSVLPAAGEEIPPKDYADFLILAQHEYFHAWLVRRLKPSAFEPFDLTREAYSTSLWLYEGFTSYYESLLAHQAGVITEEEHLKSFAERLSAAFGREGFDQLSLEEASFSAWTKLYRPTADSPYSQTSYYSKGAAAAFILDMALQREGRGTLADALAELFAERREAIARREDPGVGDREFITRVAARSPAAGALLEKLVSGWGDRAFWTAELRRALAQAGLSTAPDESAPAARRLAGLTAKPDATGRLVCGYIPSDSPAFRCGLYQGDELVAVNFERTDPSRLDRQIERLRNRGAILHWFRSGRLHEGFLDLSEPLPESFAERLPMKLVRRGEG